MTPEQSAIDLATIGKQALIDLLQNLTQAKAFAIEQAPDFCQQIVTRGIVTSAVSAFASLCAISLIAYFMRRKLKENLDDDERLMINFLTVIMVAMPSVFLFTSMSELLCIHFAPKVYIVEQITQMIK